MHAHVWVPAPKVWQWIAVLQARCVCAKLLNASQDVLRPAMVVVARGLAPTLLAETCPATIGDRLHRQKYKVAYVKNGGMVTADRLYLCRRRIHLPLCSKC